MNAETKKIEQLELQLKNLENENKILKLKNKEQSNNGKFFNDLYSLLENEKSDQMSVEDDNPVILKLK